jgi:UDP-2-acetamido-2,6-beta-L-arabino-hexul-4-ose reductase
VRIAVTGADGFLGWHVRAALRARNEDDVVPVGRALLEGPAELLDQAFAGVDAVLHLAGVNRAEPDELRDLNLALAARVTDALDRLAITPAVVYSDSIQAGNGSAYGDGKAAAAEHLLAWGAKSGARVVDLVLPNIFGEHGRPSYNSFVATFCEAIARGGSPTVLEDREVPLRHVQDVADDLLAAVDGERAGRLEVAGVPLLVTDVLERLRGFHELYHTGEVPDVRDHVDLCLFNTYRSYCFPEHYPIHPQVHSDARGHLFETVRLHGGQAQVFCSSTNPGFTRGEHFHRRKIERFQVIRGEAVIALRKVLTEETVNYAVSGDKPSIVDMPTLWSHNITNVGDGELVTLFWTADLLDPSNPDTYSDVVTRVSDDPMLAGA